MRLEYFIAAWACIAFIRYIHLVRQDKKLTVRHIVVYLPLGLVFLPIVLAIDLISMFPEHWAKCMNLTLWERKP